MCLDVGDSRIGIAVSDELCITASGLNTLERTNIKADTQKIIDTIRENGCSVVVIGLPLNLSGSDSVQTEKVRAFAKKLENKLTSNAMQGVKVELYDERFTTAIAKRAMVEAGASKKNMKDAKQSGAIDRQAAVVILEDWLRGYSRKQS